VGKMVAALRCRDDVAEVLRMFGAALRPGELQEQQDERLRRRRRKRTLGDLDSDAADANESWDSGSSHRAAQAEAEAVTGGPLSTGLEAMAGPEQHAIAAGASSSADGAPAAPCVVAAAVAAAPRQMRAIPWGPFQLAPIFKSGEPEGWGATCGQHHDSCGRGVSCKKYVSFGSLSAATLQLRLKRWLVAGLDMEETDNARSHHVKMGGQHMAHFATGSSEAELDLRVRMLGGSE
jgi:hypothetical protein